MRDAFGDIWSNWKQKREEFGPGFYLYLGTRRGLSLYPEHRFVNLIWGIEAFHRTEYAADAKASFERKMRTYITAYAAKQHSQSFGWKSFRVLTVTTDEYRKKSMIEALNRIPIPRSPGAALFLFPTREALLSASPVGQVWQEANGRRTSLA
ncbi:hypothetical protein WN73_21680 [Bradyrhizobium sp. CCBAU 45394]|nr:hypothetical protein [Bradyrhizobium sp. CCBAU 45394]